MCYNIFVGEFILKMKKSLFIIFSILFFQSISLAQSDFPTAIKNCDPYSQDGFATHNNQTFNLSITLEKAKDKCIYREKIYQGKNYQMMTCKFEKGQLPFISDSMSRYNQFYKKEIAKNPIFSAKMTSNGEVFNKILANPAYCTITYTKTKAH